MQRLAQSAGAPSWCDRILGAVVGQIRLNRVAVDSHCVTKQRNLLGQHILPAANWFFRWSGAPIMFWTETAAWVRWESACYRMLYPEFRVQEMDGGICIDRLPGKSLWRHMREKTLTCAMVRPP